MCNEASKKPKACALGFFFDQNLYISGSPSNASDASLLRKLFKYLNQLGSQAPLCGDILQIDTAIRCGLQSNKAQKKDDRPCKVDFAKKV